VALADITFVESRIGLPSHPFASRTERSRSNCEPGETPQENPLRQHA